MINRILKLLKKRDLEDALDSANQTLRQYEKQYSSLFSQIGTAVIIHDFEGLVLDMNEKALELFGYQKDELATLTLMKLHPKDSFLQAMQEYELIDEVGFLKFKIDFQNRDGHIFPAEVTSTLIATPTKKIIQSIIIDVSTTTQPEIEHEQLVYAIEQTGEVIVITDTEGTIQYVNPAFEKITGYSKEEAIGKNPRILSSGKQNEEFYTNLWTTIQRGETWHGHFVNIKKNGELYEEDATISPVRDSTGKIIHYVAVKRDVTRQRTLEEQLLLSQKMEAVGTLAGGIAHDFNNILTVIGGYADRAMSKVDPEEALHSDLKIIYNATLRGTDLTRQLLIYGRKQPMELVVLNVNTVIHDLLRMLARVIGEDVTIKSELYTDLWNLKADKGNIEQVLMNLSINARDAMPDGGELTIKTENIDLDKSFCQFVPQLTPGKYICLTVEDNGVGIGKYTLEHVFEPFFSTKGPGKGTGLGLSVVYGIVQQHMGYIDLKSTPGKGTRFRIFLPAYCKETGIEGKQHGSLKGLSGNGEKVLLVEDDPQVREFTSIILKENGYQAISAKHAEEALEIFERNNKDFEIVFSDVVLPGKSGLQLVEELLSAKPTLGVIMFSGYTDEKSQWRIILDRGYKFLHKPVLAADILQAIQEIMAEKTR